MIIQEDHLYSPEHKLSFIKANNYITKENIIVCVSLSPKQKNILWNRFKITALEINILWNIFGIAYWYQIYDKITFHVHFHFSIDFLFKFDPSLWLILIFIICIFLSSNTRSQRVDRSNSWNKMHKVLYFMITRVVRLQGQIIWWSNLYIYGEQGKSRISYILYVTRPSTRTKHNGQ